MNNLFTFTSEEERYLHSLDKEYEEILSKYAAKDSEAIRNKQTSYDDPLRSNYARKFHRLCQFHYKITQTLNFQ
jgi:hypothetical protein